MEGWGLVSAPCGSPLHTQTRGSTSAPTPRWRCALFLGIYESDDIKAIMSEMEKALNYSEKVRLRRAGRPAGWLLGRSWGCRTAPPSDWVASSSRHLLSQFPRLEVRRAMFPLKALGGILSQLPVALDACEKRQGRLYASGGAGGRERPQVKHSRDVGIYSQGAEWRGRAWNIAERELISFQGQGSPCQKDLMRIVLKAGQGLRRPLTPKASDATWGVLQGAGPRSVC